MRWSAVQFCGGGRSGIFPYLVCAFGLAVSTVLGQTTQPREYLPREKAALIDRLIEEGSPELVEELVAGGTAAHRVLVARAYATAAAKNGDAAGRDTDFEKAAAEYRQALTMGSDPDWSESPRRKFALTRWRMELADLILRQQCAGDLDEFEICYGLTPPPPRLASRLAAAVSVYREADAALREFVSTLAREEELMAAEGIAEEIGPTARKCSLNLGWALVYAAETSKAGDPERAGLLAEALRRFDTAARESEQPTERFSAVVGAGVAFRELGKQDDAKKVLEGVAKSSAPQEAKLRARYELARALLKEREYEAAGKVIAALNAPTTAPASATAEPNGDGAFYARLGPLLAAQCWLAESKRPSTQAAEQRRRAVDALMKLRESGGAWAIAANTILNQALPTDARPEMLAGDERLALARRLKDSGDWNRATSAYQAWLGGGEARTPAELDPVRFEMAECLAKTGEIRPAAKQMGELFGHTADAELSRRAGRASLEYWRAAAATGLRDDETELARTCLRVAEREPGAADADDLALCAATSFERAGQLDDAQAAYARIGHASPRFWAARSASLRCRQTAWEHSATSGVDGGPMARALVADWQRLADELKTTSSAPAEGGREGATVELRAQALLAVAELLASPMLRNYAEAEKRLAALDRPDLAAGMAARALSLRMRCLRELKRDDESAKVTSELVIRASAMAPGPELVSVAAELESEVGRRMNDGQTEPAQRLANEVVPVIKRLLDQVAADPQRSGDVPVVTFSLARMLVQAGRAEEAAPLIDGLVATSPDDSNYVRYQALVYERAARATGAAYDAQLRAEKAWEKLLEDRTLRETAPGRYWEARYYWLRWQLEHGRPDEVAKGIDAEKAWYPELGGAPWKERLMELADRARGVAKK